MTIRVQKHPKIVTKEKMVLKTATLFYLQY
jgi:hypothetical protein